MPEVFLYQEKYRNAQPIKEQNWERLGIGLYLWTKKNPPM